MSRPRPQKASSEGLFVGLSVTALVHLTLIVSFVAKTDDGCGEDASAASDEDRFAQSETIEASLAFKQVDKKNQPVKVKKKKYKPIEKGVSKDPTKKPIDKKDQPKHKVAVLDDEVDITSILEKNRSQDPDLSSTGADEKPVEGSAAGSEWGTNKNAEGDPYVGELKGRIHSEWKVPALETGGGIALGCVRLDKDGKIIDTGIKKRSKNSNLDRSVKLALKKAPKMEKPVPGHLVELLTVKGICFRFSLEKQ